MSGKHYKGPEVSCCIKYFIFGFNVIFWVSWSAPGLPSAVADGWATVPRRGRCLYFSPSPGLLPQSRREASAFRLPGSSAGERNTSSFPGPGGGEKRNRAGQGAARPQGGSFLSLIFFPLLGGAVCVGRPIAWVRMRRRLGSLRNEGSTRIRFASRGIWMLGRAWCHNGAG